MRIILCIWPDIFMQCGWFFLENYDFFLVYRYYTHPSYWTSIVGKNCAYYVRIFTVIARKHHNLS